MGQISIFASLFGFCLGSYCTSYNARGLDVRWNKLIWVCGVPCQAARPLCHGTVVMPSRRFPFGQRLSASLELREPKHLKIRVAQCSVHDNNKPGQELHKFTHSLSSLRSTDCSGSASSQSLDPSALEASRRAWSDSLVACSSRDDPRLAD